MFVQKTQVMREIATVASQNIYAGLHAFLLMHRRIAVKSVKKLSDT
jgi:hypothetical protein